MVLFTFCSSKKSHNQCTASHSGKGNGLNHESAYVVHSFNNLWLTLKVIKSEFKSKTIFGKTNLLVLKEIYYFSSQQEIVGFAWQSSQWLSTAFYTYSTKRAENRLQNSKLNKPEHHHVCLYTRGILWLAKSTNLISCQCNWGPSNIISGINICTRCNKELNALQVITAHSLEQRCHALAILAFQKIFKKVNSSYFIGIVIVTPAPGTSGT